MKKATAPKPNLETYFLAKRMEGAGLLRPGTALVLATTVKKPQSRGKSATARRGKS